VSDYPFSTPVSWSAGQVQTALRVIFYLFVRTPKPECNQTTMRRLFVALSHVEKDNGVTLNMTEQTRYVLRKANEQFELFQIDMTPLILAHFDQYLDEAVTEHKLTLKWAKATRECLSDLITHTEEARAKRMASLYTV
jgi:hypothetical protein